MKEFAITMNPTSIPAGEVKFTVRNAGVIQHEMVILKTDLDPAKLPVTDGRVDETQYKLIGEVDEVNSGAVKTGTFGLDAGKYVLLCNIAGHPAAGMYSAFTVK